MPRKKSPSKKKTSTPKTTGTAGKPAPRSAASTVGTQPARFRLGQGTTKPQSANPSLLCSQGNCGRRLACHNGIYTQPSSCLDPQCPYSNARFTVPALVLTEVP